MCMRCAKSFSTRWLFTRHVILHMSPEMLAALDQYILENIDAIPEVGKFSCLLCQKLISQENNHKFRCERLHFISKHLMET